MHCTSSFSSASPPIRTSLFGAGGAAVSSTSSSSSTSDGAASALELGPASGRCNLTGAVDRAAVESGRFDPAGAAAAGAAAAGASWGVGEDGGVHRSMQPLSPLLARCGDGGGVHRSMTPLGIVVWVGPGGPQRARRVRHRKPRQLVIPPEAVKPRCGHRKCSDESGSSWVFSSSTSRRRRTTATAGRAACGGVRAAIADAVLASCSKYSNIRGPVALPGGAAVVFHTEGRAEVAKFEETRRSPRRSCSDVTDGVHRFL